MTSGKFAIGVVCTLVGAGCWGFSGCAMKFLFSDYGLPVMFVAAFRMLVAGILLTAVLAFTARPKLFGLLADARSMAGVAVFGLIGLFCCQVTYMLAIEYTNAGTATVLQAFNVVIVLGITCVGARRLPRALELLAVAVALIATVLIATKGDLTQLNMPFMGLFWGLASAVAVTFYVCYPVKLFEKWTSPPVTALGMVIGGLVALVCMLVEELSAGAQAFSWASSIDATAVLFLVLVAVVGTLCSFGLFLYGVSIVGSVKGSLLGTIEPAAATIISAVWLHTAFVWADWVGMVLMMATVFIVSVPQKPAAHDGA